MAAGSAAHSMSPEALRLAALRALEVLDTEPDPVLDGIVHEVAAALEVPTALVSLVDRDRQWFKARVGMQAAQTCRSLSFCAHAILEPGPVLAIEDAKEDSRFVGNPLVTGAPGIRFYAGAALTIPAGFRIGTLCAIDYRPRRVEPWAVRALARFAQSAAARIMVECTTRACLRRLCSQGSAGSVAGIAPHA